DARSEIRVAPDDRALVPTPDARRIRLAKVQRPVRPDDHPRERIVHYRRAVPDTRLEIVLQAQRMTYLVSRQLPDPRKCHLLHPRVHGLPVASAATLAFTSATRHPVAPAAALAAPSIPSAVTVPGPIRLQQPLRDQIVFAVPVRPQCDHTFDDLTRPRIDITRAVGKSALRRAAAIQPVHDIIADIHGVRSLGKFLYDKGIPVTGRLERLGPP